MELGSSPSPHSVRFVRSAHRGFSLQGVRPRALAEQKTDSHEPSDGGCPHAEAPLIRDVQQIPWRQPCPGGTDLPGRLASIEDCAQRRPCAGRQAGSDHDAGPQAGKTRGAPRGPGRTVDRVDGQQPGPLFRFQTADSLRRRGNGRGKRRALQCPATRGSTGRTRRPRRPAGGDPAIRRVRPANRHDEYEPGPDLGSTGHQRNLAYLDQGRSDCRCKART